MESSTRVRVLVVAHKTAATPALIEAVRERAERGPATFTLLVPNPAHGLHAVVDPEDLEDNEGQAMLELAIPLLEEAAGAPVEGLVGVYSRPRDRVVLVVYEATLDGEPRPTPEAPEIRAFAPGDVPWDELAFWSTEQALRDLLGDDA